MVRTLVFFISTLVFSAHAEAQWWNPLSWRQEQEQRQPLNKPRTGSITVKIRRVDQCLGTTDPRERSIDAQLDLEPRDTFLAYFNNPRTPSFNQLCDRAFQHPSDRSAVALRRAGAQIRQKNLSRTCIRAAIAARANDNIPGTRSRCDGNSPTQVRGTPCVGNTYVDYLHFSINHVIHCLSGPGNEIDPDTLFGKINNESAFMSFVHSSSSGYGMMQMTGIAVREMFQPGNSGYGFLRSQMDRPERGAFCNPLKRLMQFPGDNYANVCAQIGMANGVARNALGGIGLFLYYRQRVMDHLVNKGIPRTHPRFLEMAEELALVSYSAVGDSGMRLIVDKIAGQLKSARTNNVELIRAADARYNRGYLRAIQTKRREVAGLPATCEEVP